MATYVEDIIQALKNLGGVATLNQIYDEVEHIRTVPLPKNWKANISGIIGNHSSDSTRFLGPDYFQKIGRGTWAIRNQEEIKLPPPAKQGNTDRRYKDFSPPESFETIANYLMTIKEYRDFSDPASASWIEYIQEFFHIMGFSTERKESRLILLKDMGGDNAPKAIVGYMFPGESFEEIIPGLKWETYLLYAANYHQMEWGILTNGLQLKVKNYGNRKDQPPYFWPDLDEIIKNQKLDNFFSIYKVFSYFRDQKKEPEQDLASRHKLRLEFWKGLLDQAKTLAPNFSKISPSKENWISVGAGKSGLSFAYVIRMTDAQIELYIDQGDAKINKQLFDTIYAHKERIEQAFGDSLEWQRLDEKRGSRVRYVIDGSGLLDRGKWPELQKQMIDTMIEFQKAFRPEIRRLK